MSERKVKGLGVAIVTPFLKGEVDVKGLEHMVEHVIYGGADFIVALGSTGESSTLNEEERNLVIQTIVDTSQGRIPIWSGHLASNDTRAVVKNIHDLDTTGLDGIMLSTPAYNKPNQMGLMEHYRRVSDVSSLPIMMYNVPSRTGVNMTAETSLELAQERENIIAIKEASTDWNQLNEILLHRPADFTVLSGDDPTAIASMALGADGLISVLGNALPSTFSQMVTAAYGGDYVTALKHHRAVWPFHGSLYAEGNPTGIKCLLEIMKLCSDELRLPLVRASASLKEDLTEAYQAFAGDAIYLGFSE